MRRRTIISLILLPFLFTCQYSSENESYNYGSESDSAVYYFNQGWRQILDNGQWALSESSFRKAIQFDSTFLIGKSLVGRISSNLAERQAIVEEIERQINDIEPSELLLLEAYLLSIQGMNALELKTENLTELRTQSRSVSESNFREFVYQFPDEAYIKAEYIEIIHAVHGANAALDSLEKLVTEDQSNLPFFISYSASLEVELGNFDKALQLAKHLKLTMNDTLMPEQYVLFATIYFEMDSLKIAKRFIEKAVELDSLHLIAQGMRKQIDQGILNQN